MRSRGYGAASWRVNPLHDGIGDTIVQWSAAKLPPKVARMSDFATDVMDLRVRPVPSVARVLSCPHLLTGSDASFYRGHRFNRTSIRCTSAPYLIATVGESADMATKLNVPTRWASAALSGCEPEHPWHAQSISQDLLLEAGGFFNMKFFRESEARHERDLSHPACDFAAAATQGSARLHCARWTSLTGLWGRGGFS